MFPAALELWQVRAVRPAGALIVRELLNMAFSRLTWLNDTSSEANTSFPSNHHSRDGDGLPTLSQEHRTQGALLLQPEEGRILGGAVNTGKGDDNTKRDFDEKILLPLNRNVFFHYFTKLRVVPFSESTYFECRSCRH